MRAKIRGFHSPDVELDSDMPAAGEPFMFLVQIFAGPAEGAGHESFDVEVCNIEWLQERLIQQPQMELTQMLLVARWDYDEVVSYLTQAVEAIEGRDWEQLGARIGKIGKWEFEDYEPCAPEDGQ